MSLTVWTVTLCHPECSEGSGLPDAQLLRCAQDDRPDGWCSGPLSWRVPGSCASVTWSLTD